ncbi:MAG: CapA family protein [Acidiferrobacterales bacterium]
MNTWDRTNGERSGHPELITVFLCGDVMTGRGIDQVLPHPGDPRIYEPYMRSAVGYVELAERTNGPIPKPVDFVYIWGDAFDELERVRPDVRIINLETSVTKSDDFMPKGINYRMNPENITCITAAKIDCCVLANNHILDWGYSGLSETLETLEKANVKSAGAGRNIDRAEAPAIKAIPGKGRVIVFSFGSVTSGIPREWGAGADRPGLSLLPNLSDQTVNRIVEKVRAVKRPNDIVVVSIHWGENWGYAVPRDQTAFAHKLIDEAAVTVIHGHSSHHPKGIEVYEGKPVLYGCGDFLNDYEGISGHEEFRDDLVLMYLLSIDPASGELVELKMRPLQIRKFRLNRASRSDAEWLRDTLNRESSAFGMRVNLTEANTLTLRWQ